MLGFQVFGVISVGNYGCFHGGPFHYGLPTNNVYYTMLLMASLLAILLCVRYLQFRRNKHLVWSAEQDEAAFQMPNVLGLYDSQGLRMPTRTLTNNTVLKRVLILFLILLLILGMADYNNETLLNGVFFY